MIGSSLLGGLVFWMSDSMFFCCIWYFDQNFRKLSSSDPVISLSHPPSLPLSLPPSLSLSLSLSRSPSLFLVPSLPPSLSLLPSFPPISLSLSLTRGRNSMVRGEKIVKPKEKSFSPRSVTFCHSILSLPLPIPLPLLPLSPTLSCLSLHQAGEKIVKSKEKSFGDTGSENQNRTEGIILTTFGHHRCLFERDTGESD